METENTGEVEYIDLSKPLQKENVGKWVKKSDFLNKSVTITDIENMGRTQFKKPFLECKIDGEQCNLEISKSNKNDLLDLLGNDFSLWKDKSLKMTGTHWEGEIKGELVTGTQLNFTLVV